MAALTGIDLIYQLIVDDTGRGDLQEAIWRKIHRSALNWHRCDDWKRDFVEDVYVFEQDGTAVPSTIPPVTGSNALFMNWAGQVQNAINVQQIDISQLRGFRKIGYLRKWQTVTPTGTQIYDPTTGQQGTVQGGDLVERSPDSMFDGYGYDKTDTFYRSGNLINISSSTPLDKVFIGYFVDPVLNLGCQTLQDFQTYSSWIIDNYPDLIVYDVVNKIFTDIGKNEEANGIAKLDLPREELRLRAAETRVSLR